MKTLFFILMLAVPALAVLAVDDATAPAQTNVIYGYVGDYGQVVAEGVPVTSTLLWPKPRTVGNVLVQSDPVTHYSDAAGFFAFTNQAWGIYQLSMPNGYAQVYYVFTNTLGEVTVANLFTNSYAYLTNTPINVTTDYNSLSNLPPLVTLTNWNNITLSNGGVTITGNLTNTVLWIGWTPSPYPTNWGVVNKPGWTNNTGYTCYVTLTNNTLTTWFDPAGNRYSPTNANISSGVVMPGGSFTNVTGGGQYHAFR